MRALSIASTGMLAQQLNVEVISNNIANMNTTGFKRQRASFHDLLYQNVERAGAASSDSGTVNSNGVQVGVGVRAGAVYRITEQGDLQSTENMFDMAIQGRGYFRVQMPDGDYTYTRAGSFGLSPDGQMVTAQGYTVMPGINIPQDATDVSINAQGEVSAMIPGDIGPTVQGQLEMATFFNEGGLQAIGQNLFKESGASGSANIGVPGTDGIGSIIHGMLETSNVNAVQEITNLITAQRAYEMNAKVISAADEMLSVTSNLK